MNWSRIREAFDALIDLPESERAQRLAEIERTEAWLARELHHLLASDAQASRFLDRDGAAAIAPAPDGAPGTRIGRFTLVRPLGSGGMGAVWEARQDDPARTVAIKLTTWNRPSDMERWRFQHETRVLAALNHPAIATFYEAGTSMCGASEVAWFAMELVPDAVDCLAWADRRELSRRQRLALFLQLCDAVDHGHQRGVLHRDLKPGNVLVDAEGRIKLIDFGIARALHGTEAEGQRTATGELVGTIHYMAPEQLAGRTAAIGTHSDVWSLGVLLYQLLCGRAPFAANALPLHAVAELVLRQEPTPPRTARADLPEDLGWVLLRALEKEPARRYATVREFAADLERWLGNQPVRARPASLGYRLRKFVRRHRLGVAAASAITLVSAAAVTMTALALVDTRRAEAAERRGRRTAEASLDFLVDVLSSPGPDKQGRDTKMVDALQRIAAGFGETFRDDAEIRAVVARALGRTLFGLGMLPEAERHLRSSITDAAAARGAMHHDTVQAELELTRVLQKQGRLDDADAQLRTVEQKLADAPSGSPLTDRAAVYRSDLQRARGDRPGAVATLRPVLQRLREREPDSDFTLQVMNQLAGALHESGDVDAAEALYREALAGIVQKHGDDHPDAITAMMNLAMAQQSHGRFEAALPTFERALAARRRVLGETHVDTVAILVGLGGLHVRLGRLDDAADRLSEALTALGPTPDERSPVYQVALSNLSVVERDRKHWPRAIELGERLLAMRQRTRGESHPDTLMTMATLADTQRHAGQIDGALERLTRCRDLAAAASPPVLPIVYQCDLALGWCHAERAEFALAEPCFLRCLESYDAAEQASANKGRLFRADPELVALYKLWGKPELAARYESAHSRARDPDPALQGRK